MSYKIKAKQVEGGLGGNGIYNSAYEDNVLSTAIGGAPSATAGFWKTQTISQVLDLLLFPYQKPGMSITVSGDSILEVGDSLPLTLTIDWSSSNGGNAQNGVTTISDTTTPVTIATAQNKTGTLQYTYATAITKPVVASHSWSASGINSNGQAYSGSTTKNWYWKRYWGGSTNPVPTSALITNLANSDLSNSRGGPDTGGIYSGFSSSSYKYFALPASAGTPTKILDVTDGLPGKQFVLANAADGFDQVAGSITWKNISITNGNGKTSVYKVFRSKYLLTAATKILVE